jgi:hypothetical protein
VSGRCLNFGSMLRERNRLGWNLRSGSMSRIGRSYVERADWIGRESCRSSN